MQIIVFGGGCFWCTEAVFKQLKGVVSVMPGYAGGQSNSSVTSESSERAPTYEEVCSGKTGQAEVIRIEYDPVRISFKDLLTVFFAVHDPTTLNRQGNDVGTQYRSIILFTAPEQEKEAQEFIAVLNKEGQKVVTEVNPLKKFYEAESYHKDYYQNNLDKPYCQIIISSKLEKLKEKFYQLF